MSYREDQRKFKAARAARRKAPSISEPEIRDRDFVRLDWYAAERGVSPRTLKRWGEAGWFPRPRQCGKYLFVRRNEADEAMIERMMESRKLSKVVVRGGDGRFTSSSTVDGNDGASVPV